MDKGMEIKRKDWYVVAGILSFGESKEKTSCVDGELMPLSVAHCTLYTIVVSKDGLTFEG